MSKTITEPTSYEDVLKNGVYTLSKPFKFEDQPETVTLLLPMSKMTGADIIAAQENYEVMGNMVSGVLELNKKFQAFVCAQAAGVRVDFITSLPVADFSRLTMYVQRFLLSGE